MAKSPVAKATKARGGSSRTPTIAAVATLVVLAVVVFGGVFWSSRGGGTDGGAIPPAPVQASYVTSLDGGVIVAGSPSAPHTIDLYEDALCPACQAFERQYGEQVTDALNTGRVQVRYHMVNLLDESSQPPGYSTAGGNAMMCAAENGAFPAVHASLYAAQPSEGGAGFTTEQLVGLGKEVGAAPGYAGCVQSSAHAAAVKANYRQALTNPALTQTSATGASGFGTPTVVVDGTRVDPGAPELTAALR